jgi:hypothetical protein
MDNGLSDQIQTAVPFDEKGRILTHGISDKMRGDVNKVE